MTSRALVGVLLLLALGGSLWWSGGEGEAHDLGSTPRSPTAPTFASPTSCRECHPDVYAEWDASMHAAAFTDPQVRAPEQSDNFRRTECLACHAPRPLFEHGIEPGTRVLARVERRADGIDCLSCHGLGADGGVAATRQGLSGPCSPVYRRELSTHQACAACHDQHNLHQEWLASPAAEAGTDCAACHMQRVTREHPSAGAPRAGRSHRFLGGRDRDFAIAGLELGAEVVDGNLRATLHNRFAGHNLPSDSRNRAMDLVVSLYDGRGTPIPPAADEERESWARRGTARRRFRNPYRSSGDPNTQLPAGETAVLSVPLPPEAVRATIELFYKLQPFIPDEEAKWSLSRELLLPDDG